jgi:ubiquitin carboxyl-terminal hydrolase 35/38
VHKVFGGKLQTTYQCSNCKSISLHKEGFTDLHLAFPEKKSSNSQGQEGSSSAPPQASVPLTMQKLLENYLKPEILQVSTWCVIV